MKKLFTLSPALIAGLAPLLAFAQPSPDEVNTLINQVKTTFNEIIIFLYVLATVIFIWGVIMYIAQADDEGARKKAKQLMLWGIVGLAVITAVWGIVNVILNYFFSGTVEIIPSLPGDI